MKNDMAMAFAIPPVIDKVILMDSGITFVVGGYLSNGVREQHQAFIETLTANALNMAWFRVLGVEVIDNRTPQQIDVNEATDEEIEAAMAAEIWSSPVIYQERGEM